MFLLQNMTKASDADIQFVKRKYKKLNGENDNSNLTKILRT